MPVRFASTEPQRELPAFSTSSQAFSDSILSPLSISIMPFLSFFLSFFLLSVLAGVLEHVSPLILSPLQTALLFRRAGACSRSHRCDTAASAFTYPGVSRPVRCCYSNKASSRPVGARNSRFRFPFAPAPPPALLTLCRAGFLARVPVLLPEAHPWRLPPGSSAGDALPQAVLV